MNDEPRPITLAELRVVVTDPAELAKGTQILDRGGLAHFARHGSKLFAEAAGSGAAPYRPQIVFEEKGPRGRCSCMAARTRPFCKHAAALLVAWARDPAGFAVAEAPAAPPAGTEPGEPRRIAPKRAKTDKNALLRSGVEQVLTLVRELAVAGVGAIAAERAEQVRALAETLRAEGLRRLSARTLELARLLTVAARHYAAFDPAEYAAALGDLLLSAKRIAKHLDGGDALKPEHVEELIGRTWGKKDRQPVNGLDLVEYSFRHAVTADDFSIRESRFLDLRDGAHYSEKQILPAFLAKRTAPKASYQGLALRGAAGSRYPGFPPGRLEITEKGAVAPLDTPALEALTARLVPSVRAALAALQEQRKDPFAPDLLPVGLACDTLCADAGRLFALDADGHALALPADADAEALLTSALAEAELVALLGDMMIDGALPALFPHAVLLRRGGALELVPVATDDPSARRERAGAKPEPAPVRRRWLESARELGVSPGAVILGEVREEMAEALAEGLGSLDARRAAPWAARLGELNLAKPAALLTDLAARPDPADKLDDAIKLHQVFGLGLARLAGVRAVDRAQMTASPLHPSIHVRAPGETWPADELLDRLGRDGLGRHERAVVVARSLAACSAEDLGRLAHTLWSDGSLTVLVAEVYARHPALALERAREILTSCTGNRSWSMMSQHTVGARVAKMSALRVLSRLTTPEARVLLIDCSKASGLEVMMSKVGRQLDPALRAFARQCLWGKPDPVPPEMLDGLLAANREDRVNALRRLGERGVLAALPPVRQLAASDPSREVRRAAWAAQALLLDVDAAEPLIARLRQRRDNDDDAREAATALGLLGDRRSNAPLLDAFEETWKPGVIAESLRNIGPSILPALLDRVEARPELAARVAGQQVVTGLPADETLPVFLARLPDPLDEPGVTRAALLLKLSAGLPPLAEALRRALAGRGTTFAPNSPTGRRLAKLL